MLIRPHDDETEDETRWRDFVISQGFGHLVAAGRDRPVPVVVPTQYLLEADDVVLHLARPNPMFDCLEENPRCLLSVAGDWAYIPGSWRAIEDEDPQRGIPTTYYAAVQLTCTATVLDEPRAIAGVLGKQLGSLEPYNDYVDPIDHGAKLATIRGLVLHIDQVRAKFKFGANVDQAHREHVAVKLEERTGPGDLAALRHIRL